ncbi:MAG: type II toxin-antitoxin system VapC family toxin [Acidobacteriota bacterium]|nr:type II toxin-antitoxin system VapC family toxin [Acidobacteriota bacterium]
MNVVDSSGWLEYFAGGPNANFFAKPIEATAELVVPTLSLYEVFKRIAQQRGEGDALQAVSVMQQGKVVELSSMLALSAAQVSLQLSIPMADSVILATARAEDAVLWTQDADFATVPGVRYVARKTG